MCLAQNQKEKKRKIQKPKTTHDSLTLELNLWENKFVHVFVVKWTKKVCSLVCGQMNQRNKNKMMNRSPSTKTCQKHVGHVSSVKQKCSKKKKEFKMILWFKANGKWSIYKAKK
jgi:hypothetical protein